MPLVFILRTNEPQPSYITRNRHLNNPEDYMSKDRNQAFIYSTKARATAAKNTHFKFLQEPVILESIKVTKEMKDRAIEQEQIDKENARREKEERQRRWEERQQEKKKNKTAKTSASFSLGKRAFVRRKTLTRLAVFLVA